MTRNDELWKGLIENIFPHFIPFFLPGYQHLFDLQAPVAFLDKELHQLHLDAGEQDSRFVDKLVKVQTVSGKERWVLVHIEVQGYSDALFAERMFRYYYRILDRYHIPVTAIAIFTDSHAMFAPDIFFQDFAGTELHYRYNTYKIRQQDKDLLMESNNPFAIAILTVMVALEKKKIDDNNLLQLKIELIRQLYSKGFSEAVVRSLLVFIRLYVNFARPETANIFEKQIEPLIKNAPAMDDIFEIGRRLMREEAIGWGKVEGTREKENFFVENLLRNSDFDEERIAFLAGVPVEFVREVKSKMQ